MNQSAEPHVFDNENIWLILLKIAPPVMLALLIQSMYNIVDSFFIGQYSGDGLTALSIIYPIQLVIVAIAVGTGVGVNTLMSRYYARKKTGKADKAAGTGTALAVISYAVFAISCIFWMRPYVMMSAGAPQAIEYAVTYGLIVCVGSLGIFLESNWTKVHQAGGNMRLPMIAQVTGAATNIALDPILIFGWGFIPALGIAGAAYATVAGQIVAAIITFSGYRRPPATMREFLACTREIYRLGYPSIFMQMLYTVYIVALNIILAGFSDAAVTVLGLYYKLQSFFFIPLTGMMTCIVPLLSYTFAKRAYERCRQIMTDSIILSMGFMLVGVLCFELIPIPLINIFSTDAEVMAIGESAFRIIGLSFLPSVIALISPVFFQAIGTAVPSVFLSLLRQIFCLIPIFWGLSKIGLFYCWFAFPISEVITGTIGTGLYIYQLREWNIFGKRKTLQNTRGVITMKMITAIVNKKDMDIVCKALTEAGFYFTKMATTGGFLTSGNTTLMIGTEDNKVEQVISIIRSNCSRRVEQVPSFIQAAVPSVAYPTEVTVGGATVFVTPVEHFEKM